MKSCRVLNMGTLEYQKAWDLQRLLALQISQGEQPDTLLLLEHPSVFTLGRLASRDLDPLSRERLDSTGVSIYEVDRGGKATYHGPGQLIAYPIVSLRRWGGPLKYIRTLEQIMIKTLSDHNITADSVDGLTGVWVGDNKIGAIGIKVTSGVALHGMSLNVNVDLSPFQHIVPCGILNKGVTSMEKLLGTTADIDAVAYSFVYHFGTLMGFHMVEVEDSYNLGTVPPTTLAK